MTNENRSHLFIPGISGLTRYVTASELEHNEHFIDRQPEVIIDSKIIDLTFSVFQYNYINDTLGMITRPI